MAFPVYSIEYDAWAMWMPWLRNFRRIDRVFPDEEASNSRDAGASAMTDDLEQKVPGLEVVGYFRKGVLAGPVAFPRPWRDAPEKHGLEPLVSLSQASAELEAKP